MVETGPFGVGPPHSTKGHPCPTKHGNETGDDEESVPETSLHAHGEGREEGIEGEVGGGGGDEQDADTAENTGGATSGGPGGSGQGEEDPSQT